MKFRPRGTKRLVTCALQFPTDGNRYTGSEYTRERSVGKQSPIFRGTFMKSLPKTGDSTA
jgi:hypothetical protein